MADRGQPNETRVLKASYSATITVSRSRKMQLADSGGYFHDSPHTDSDTLAEIKVSSTSLEGLQNKIKQHTDLIEDE